MDGLGAFLWFVPFIEKLRYHGWTPKHWWPSHENCLPNIFFSCFSSSSMVLVSRKIKFQIFKLSNSKENIAVPFESHSKIMGGQKSYDLQMIELRSLIIKYNCRKVGNLFLRHLQRINYFIFDNRTYHVFAISTFVFRRA